MSTRNPVGRNAPRIPDGLFRKDGAGDCEVGSLAVGTIGPRQSNGTRRYRITGGLLLLCMMFTAFTIVPAKMAVGADDAIVRASWDPLLRKSDGVPEPEAVQSRPVEAQAQAAETVPQAEGLFPPGSVLEVMLHFSTTAPESQVPHDDLVRLEESLAMDPASLASASSSVLVPTPLAFPRTHCRTPLRRLALRNIPPLYLQPKLAGEGVWEWRGLPTVQNGWPAIYKTSYRPSRMYANAVVHMLLFDMKKVALRLYIGSAEPHAPANASQIEAEKHSRLLAVTNGLWKQKHSRKAGAIYRSRVLNKMVAGMASIIGYRDETVDIAEWQEGQDIDSIRDARQLRHLIVKDGKVVRSVTKRGRRVDAEIGLGYLLSEHEPQPYQMWGPYGYFRGPQMPQINRSEEWFIATRSAFGIRRDGNLVFAIGHHISTKDLAKALVLAGCERAIHGDANPHNVVGNLYYRDSSHRIFRAAKLSPDQKSYTLQRYLNSSYTSDFFAFFSKFQRPPAEETVNAMETREARARILGAIP